MSKSEHRDHSPHIELRDP